jgi:hypothetical protein
MIIFRWFILRLFWSLLLLPLAAYALLWLLHEIISPNTSFNDGLVVLVTEIFLFVVVSYILSSLGAKKFSLLAEAGREAVAKNQNEEAENVLALLQSLFTSGLLSNAFQQKVKRDLLRQYFSLHAAHLEKAPHREKVREAVREGIRAEEGYEILKNYVLQQPALTLPVIDLAEELLEHQPDDGDLLTFLTRQYLQERQTHFRAEPIFSRYLARNGPLTPEIISLCLDRLLARESRQVGRLDDFAVWCYVRAFQRGGENDAALQQSLHEAYQRFQRFGRHDALAKAVAAIAAEFTPEAMARWAVERREKPTLSLRFRLARIIFYLQQRLLEFYSRLREQRHWVYGAAALIVLGVTYFAFFSKPAKAPKQAASAPAEDSTVVYFALQVGAMRDAKIAAREAEQLRRRGLEVHVLKPGPSQRLHRIRVGKYRNKQAAQMAADSLKTVGIVRDCFIADYEKQ